MVDLLIVHSDCVERGDRANDFNVLVRMVSQCAGVLHSGDSDLTEPEA